MNYSFGALLCLIVLAISTNSICAQNKTLTDGNPPLTGQMVERYAKLMEWSLDIRFLERDREMLQKHFVTYWQTNDRKNIKAVLDTLAFEQNLASQPEAKKQEIQSQLKEKVLAALREDEGEPVIKLLLDIYQRSQTSTDLETGGTADLSALVGKWQVLHGNSIVGVHQPSGRIGDGNSMIAEYDIKPDGRVAFTFVLQQANYGCTTKVKTYKTGRAVVSGSRVTFDYDAGGTTISEDNCNAKYNYTKKLAAEKETFDFQLKSEKGKPQFCFANAKLKDCAIKVK
jgi:hypothetical protein